MIFFFRLKLWRLQWELILGRRLHLSRSRNFQVFANCFFRVHPQKPRVGANESFIENAAGKLLEIISLYGPQKPGADLGGFGGVIQRNALPLPLLLHLCAQRRQDPSQELPQFIHQYIPESGGTGDVSAW